MKKNTNIQSIDTKTKHQNPLTNSKYKNMLKLKEFDSNGAAIKAWQGLVVFVGFNDAFNTMTSMILLFEKKISDDFKKLTLSHIYIPSLE